VGAGRGSTRMEAMAAVASSERRATMTATIQPHDNDSRHLLVVVANPTTSTTTGWPVGFWASELFHPLYGVSGLVDVKLSDGSYLVDGRTVTGLANEALGV
jgi:hypothetical protein